MSLGYRVLLRSPAPFYLPGNVHGLQDLSAAI